MDNDLAAARSKPARLAAGVVAGLAVGVLGLAGCAHSGAPAGRVPRDLAPGGTAGPPTLGAVASGRYVRQVRVGGLLVVPPSRGKAARHRGLTWRQAAALFKATSAVQGVHARAILGYGLVTLAGSSLPPGTPRLERRPAWVGITWGGTVACPAERSSPAGRSPAAAAASASHRPILTAVVIFGAHGDGAVVYTSRGSPPCGGRLKGPTVSTARTTHSMPWRQLGPVRRGAAKVRYHAPACALPSSTSVEGNVRRGRFTLTVEVTVPSQPSGCQATVARTTTVRLFPPQRASGQPASPRRVHLAHGHVGLVPVLQVGHIAGAP